MSSTFSTAPRRAGRAPWVGDGSTTRCFRNQCGTRCRARSRRRSLRLSADAHTLRTAAARMAHTPHGRSTAPRTPREITHLRCGSPWLPARIRAQCAAIARTLQGRVAPGLSDGAATTPRSGSPGSTHGGESRQRRQKRRRARRVRAWLSSRQECRNRCHHKSSNWVCRRR